MDIVRYPSYAMAVPLTIGCSLVCVPPFHSCPIFSAFGVMRAFVLVTFPSQAFFCSYTAYSLPLKASKTLIHPNNSILARQTEVTSNGRKIVLIDLDLLSSRAVGASSVSALKIATILPTPSLDPPKQGLSQASRRKPASPRSSDVSGSQMQLSSNDYNMSAGDARF
jgi:hypothetical protein